MSDPIPVKRRGNPAMRAGAPSLNPKGRPRTGLSLAEAMRERFPPERIVELAEKLAEKADSEQVRLAALQMIAERSHGKVLAEHALRLSHGHVEGADDYAQLTNEQLLELAAGSDDTTDGQANCDSPSTNGSGTLTAGHSNG